MNNERSGRALARVLHLELSSQERKALLKAASDPELDPTEVLVQGASADLLLRAVAGPEAQLGAQESDEIFESFWSSAQSQPAAAPVSAAPPGSKHRWRPLLMAAVVLLAAGAALWWGLSQEAQRSPYDGIKVGAVQPPPAARLRLMLGDVRSGEPRIVGDWRPGQALDVGQALLIRVELDAPAHVTLLEADQDAFQVLWTSPRALQAGSHELSDRGQALAYIVDAPVSLGVIVSADSLHDEVLGNLGAPTAEALAAVCPTCALTTVELQVRR